MDDKAHIPYRTAKRFLIELIKNNDFSGDEEIIRLLHSILQDKSCLSYFTAGTMSCIRIDKEARIFLPDYSDQEVKMPCLPKTVFLFFLIPGTPKDLISYAVGLTDLSLKKWILITAVGRFPAIYLSALSGTALGNQDYGIFILVLVIIGALSAAGYLVYRRKNGKEGPKE